MGGFAAESTDDILGRSGTPDILLSSGGVEIELKFQVPAARRQALERALATRTAQRLPLRALYFDTPDSRLATAAIALRLRREGQRWVQTLKGRGDGLMRRLEDEVALSDCGDAAPALDLNLHDATPAGQALRRALAGAARPQVLYETDIQRLRRVLHSGGARVEVALDVGRIEAGANSVAVCEVEFELLAGPAAGLLALAARWVQRFGLVLDVTTKSERGHALALGQTMQPVARGSLPAVLPGQPLAQARALMVGATLAQALPNAAAVSNGSFRPEHVHQLRVALRRLRTVLRAFGPADAVRDDQIVTLFGALGGARDADVSALTLAPAWAAAAAAGCTPPPPRPAVAPDGARQALCSPQTALLWLQLIALTLPDPLADSAPWDGIAAEAVLRWRRRARRVLAGWPTLDDVGRHRVRRQLKRLRYLLDYSAPLWPAKVVAAELKALRPLQDSLGRWNDIVVARALLAGWPDPVPAVHVAAGWLAREAVLADAGCASAAERWRRLPPLAAPKRQPK
jgi:inorganic triphosphatase YgiF